MLAAGLDLARRVAAGVVPRGAPTLAILSLGYFGMGIIRNRVFATTFGAGPELDAYNAAFRLPEIALDILVASGLSAPFVPIFSRLRDGPEGTARAEAFGRTVLTAAIVVTAISMAALAIVAPWIAERVFSSFDPPTRALYVDLLRINCLAQVAFAGSIALGEVLVAGRRFLFYGLAPILYTGGIVAGTVLLGPAVGVLGAAVGALGGAILHLAVRAAGVAATGFRLGPGTRVRTPEFREFIRLMVPRMLGYPIDPVVVFFMTLLATEQGPGNATALAFVLDYQFVPVQLVAITFSLAAFPTLAAAHSAGDRPRFVRILAGNLAVIGSLTAAAALLLALVARPLIQGLLGGGRFGPDAVALTASLLTAFAISIPIDALSYPLSRAMYATENTANQVLASLAGLGTLVATSAAAVPTLGIVGIPVAYAAGGVVKVVVLGALLLPRVRRIGGDAMAGGLRGRPSRRADP